MSTDCIKGLTYYKSYETEDVSLLEESVQATKAETANRIHVNSKPHALGDTSNWAKRRDTEQAFAVAYPVEVMSTTWDRFQNSVTTKVLKWQRTWRHAFPPKKIYSWLSLNLEKSSEEGRLDDSAGRGACYQLWLWPVVPGPQLVEGDPTPTGHHPLTSTSELWHMSFIPCVNVIKKKTL